MIKSIETSLKELKIKCTPVEPEEDISQIIADLEDTLKTQKGYALAANQIGYKKQIAVVRMDKVTVNLINPEIISKETKIRFPESCLSFPGLQVQTSRYQSVLIESGQKDRQRFIFNGLEAVVCQHEIDHLKRNSFYRKLIL